MMVSRGECLTTATLHTTSHRPCRAISTKPSDSFLPLDAHPPLHNFLTEGSTSPRKRRVFAKSSYTSLVLWPDGSVFKEDVPNCVKHARYIYTSPVAQGAFTRNFEHVIAAALVAHLAEYLVLRARMEAGWADYNKVGFRSRLARYGAADIENWGVTKSILPCRVQELTEGIGLT